MRHRIQNVCIAIQQQLCGIRVIPNLVVFVNTSGVEIEQDSKFQPHYRARKGRTSTKRQFLRNPGGVVSLKVVRYTIIAHLYL